MLKFVVVIFLVIMASTFAQKCGDDVCDAGSCCVTYSQRHCKKLGQLHDMCSKPDQGTDRWKFRIFLPLRSWVTLTVGTIGHVKNHLPVQNELVDGSMQKMSCRYGNRKHKGF
uniref:U25-Hexatoxin-Hc1dd_1 n=3 Tax=Hadronyche cerberea TaxID=1107879 RepID=A0A4Q8KB76_HADCE